ncbi:putative reverse transcriptase [Calothrix sp. NIES-4071]|nr:putative reverse transcriptase [Calothrix sp. NIES-4071]BAZ12928.1 putative reverse transcriptase [Calothrix sp. NIES-4071]BAZ55247.1 putative reverse transcriptase [Calothrix sp. NIES-4105]BAZ59074.1 putative reverse transcriptase [Calothrix sp. NIES-4105]
MEKLKSDSILDTEGWKSINWRKVERYVFKLQKRIYAASRCGDIKRVRKLQRTLMRSWSNRVLAVRRVTQDNQGKKTAGVDGIKVLSPEARLNLANGLYINGKSKPTRRIWIPKPGKTEKRPLSIPTIFDRALQAVVKATLEPEWEARFEPSNYGFRPGRSCHDAIKHIKNCIVSKAKFVLDADISQCFDRINHKALLLKLNVKGKIKQQIKAWLKSGAIDSGKFIASNDGTPQGGVLSPLLANIALHGLENLIDQEFPANKSGKVIGSKAKFGQQIQKPTFIRYADDFVVLNESKAVIIRCEAIIKEWLKGIGLELKPEKTRITHTFHPHLSEDGIAGFDFLGHHIQQHPAGKYRDNKNSRGISLGFVTLITPSKKAIEAHKQNIKTIFTKNKSRSQAQLIKDLNPVIRGWARYYRVSDAGTTGDFARLNRVLYLRLRRWAKRQTGSTNKGHQKYWHTIGDKKWVFATRPTSDALELITYIEFHSSVNDYVKVLADKSPYDGDSLYWSQRLSKHPEMPSRKSLLLKQQKGKCAWCGLHFKEGDVLEVDHIEPTTCGGKDKWENLQLLHRHCHDEKTASDGSQKSRSDKRETH